MIVAVSESSRVGRQSVRKRLPYRQGPPSWPIARLKNRHIMAKLG
jgi:hypothetical protein